MIILDISLSDALKIAFNSIILLFIVLGVLMLIVFLFKFIPEVEIFAKKHKKKTDRKYRTFSEMDEDMQVAVLTATICYKNEVKDHDVKLKSVKKI